MNGQQKPINRAVKGLAYGLVVGWAVGMLSWALMISFVPPEDVKLSERWEQGQVTVWERLAYAPLVAIPWAIAGGMAGGVIGLMGGWLEVVTVFVGMIGGIWGSLLLNLSDGWIVLVMPSYAFIGTFMGLAVGCLVRLVSMLFIALVDPDNWTTR